MQCLEIQQYFSAYVDGELSKKQADLVSRHLSDCPGCRKEYQIWQRVWEALLLEQVQAPSELAKQVLSRLPRRPQLWWRHMALAASLLVGIFLGGKVGLDLHQTFDPRQAENAQLNWEGFEATPANSLDAMLASHELDNGGGS